MPPHASAAALDSVGPVSGELAGFEQELIPLLVPAYRLALGMLADPGLAADAVQEASLRAWDRRANRRTGSALGPWFYAIVANRCRRVRRGRWARLIVLAEPEDGLSREPVDMAASLDIRRALRALPAKARLAVVLRFYLDLPYDEIATTLGCSVNAAKLRVSRATGALRRMLDATEVST